MSANPSLAVVERFVDAIERGDLAALNGCFAPHALIWHNTDQKWTTTDENSAAATHFFETFTRRKYAVERLEPLSNGAILQFVASIEKTDGRALDWPCCAVCEIEGGKIVKLMEYIDAASFAAAVG